MSRHCAKAAWVVGILFVLSALLNGFLIVRQMQAYKEIDGLNAKLTLDPQVAALVQKAPQVQNITRSLVGDLLVYGQKEPEIGPILLKYGVKPPAPAPPR